MAGLKVITVTIETQEYDSYALWFEPSIEPIKYRGYTSRRNPLKVKRASR